MPAGAGARPATGAATGLGAASAGSTRTVAAGATDHRSPAPEWDFRRIRNALLWLGSLLSGLSALGFAGYEWTRLGPGGRALILLGVTVLVCGSAPAVRRRLPATAEALAALGQGLVVVDWALARHAGLGTGLGTVAWWAIGSLLLAGLGVGLGCFGLAAGRVVAAVGVVAALPLSIATQIPLGLGPTGESGARVALWAAVAVVDLAAARLLWSSARWHLSAAAGLVGAGCVQAIAYLQAGALVLLTWSGQVNHPGMAALAVAATAAGPALARGLWRAHMPDPETASWADAAVFAAAASLTGAAIVASWAAVDRRWLPIAAVGAAVLCLAGMRLAPASFRRGMSAVGLLAGVSGSIVGLAPAAASVLGPLGWWRHGWSGSLSLPAASHMSGPLATRPGLPPYVRPSAPALAAICGAAACVVAITAWSAPAPRRGDPERPGRGARFGAILSRPRGIAILAALAVPAFALAPLVAGADIGVVIGAEAFAVSALVAGSSWALRRHLPGAGAPAVAAAVLAVTCLGWSTAVSSATLVILGLCLACSAAISLSAARQARTKAVSAAAAAVFLLSFAGVACTAGGLAAPVASFVVVLAAGGLLVALHLWPAGSSQASGLVPARNSLIGVAIAGLLAPDLITFERRSWVFLACNLTVAVVGDAGVGLLPGRGAYRWAAGIGTMPLTWCWLVASDVHLLEAYTWTTGLALVALGLAATRTDATAPKSSWMVFGPGLTLALLPSTVLAISQSGLVRPICVAVLALGAVLAGARWRLRAPVALGGASLVILGLDAAWPYVTTGPRWVSLGIAGAVLLWMGATLERRMAGLRSLRSCYRRFS